MGVGLFAVGFQAARRPGLSLAPLAARAYHEHPHGRHDRPHSCHGHMHEAATPTFTAWTQTGSSGNYWRFTGERRDSEIGFYYMRARYR